MNEDQRLHLQLIQNVISRMASNSFALKGWSVAISAALMGLAAKNADTVFAVLALYPALSFWGLDAYYLRQERLFRKLFSAACRGSSVPVYSMDTHKYAPEVGTLFAVAMSDTIRRLHLPILVAILAVLTFTLCR